MASSASFLEPLGLKRYTAELDSVGAVDPAALDEFTEAELCEAFDLLRAHATILKRWLTSRSTVFLSFGKWGEYGEEVAFVRRALQARGVEVLPREHRRDEEDGASAVETPLTSEACRDVCDDIARSRTFVAFVNEGYGGVGARSRDEFRYVRTAFIISKFLPLYVYVYCFQHFISLTLLRYAVRVKKPIAWLALCEPAEIVSDDVRADFLNMGTDSYHHNAPQSLATIDWIMSGEFHTRDRIPQPLDVTIVPRRGQGGDGTSVSASCSGSGRESEREGGDEGDSAVVSEWTSSGYTVANMLAGTQVWWTQPCRSGHVTCVDLEVESCFRVHFMYIASFEPSHTEREETRLSGAGKKVSDAAGGGTKEGGHDDDEAAGEAVGRSERPRGEGSEICVEAIDSAGSTRVLVPFASYGSYRGGGPGSPRHYTPTRLCVETRATRFRVSVRHNRGRGLAYSAGVAIFRITGSHAYTTAQLQ